MYVTSLSDNEFLNLDVQDNYAFELSLTSEQAAMLEIDTSALKQASDLSDVSDKLERLAKALQNSDVRDVVETEIVDSKVNDIEIVNDPVE